MGGGRLITSGRETPLLNDSTVHPRIAAYLAEAPLRHFGESHWGRDAEEGRRVQEWTGIMGFTVDGHPLVGQAEGQRGLWVCAGFNGHGESFWHKDAEAGADEYRDGTGL